MSDDEMITSFRCNVPTDAAWHDTLMTMNWFAALRNRLQRGRMQACLRLTDVQELFLESHLRWRQPDGRDKIIDCYPCRLRHRAWRQACDGQHLEQAGQGFCCGVRAGCT